MAHFDATKAYARQEDIFFDDGREIELLHFVYSRENLDELRGCPERVLEAIDDYGRTKKYLMNVGEEKGCIVTNAIADKKPKLMVELGGYVGYSAILFGNALRKAGGSKYLTLERNPEFAAVILSLVNLAGLSDVVQVIVGPSDTSLKRLHSQQLLSQIDLLFLDHYKPAYLPDLKLCEQLGLVRPGTILAADNVIKPGNPPYLEYVRSSPETKRANANDSGERSGLKGFGEKTSKQYERRGGEEKLDSKCAGDPNLVYESRLVESFEPTGVPDGIELTECVGREDVL